MTSAVSVGVELDPGSGLWVGGGQSLGHLEREREAERAKSNRRFEMGFQRPVNRINLGHLRTSNNTPAEYARF